MSAGAVITPGSNSHTKVLPKKRRYFLARNLFWLVHILLLWRHRFHVPFSLVELFWCLIEIANRLLVILEENYFVIARYYLIALRVPTFGASFYFYLVFLFFVCVSCFCFCFFSCFLFSSIVNQKIYLVSDGHLSKEWEIYHSTTKTRKAGWLCFI